MHVCMHVCVCVLTEGRHGSSVRSSLVIMQGCCIHFLGCGNSAPLSIGFLSRKVPPQSLEARSPRPRCQLAGLAPSEAVSENLAFASLSAFQGLLAIIAGPGLQKHDLNLRLYLHMPFSLCACLGPRSPFSLGPPSSLH